jgi:hypothetical protein
MDWNQAITTNSGTKNILRTTLDQPNIKAHCQNIIKTQKILFKNLTNKKTFL